MAKANKKKFISQEYSATEQGKNLKEGTRGGRTATIVATSFFSFAILMAAGMIAFTAMYFFSEVIGSSMMKTLNANFLPDQISTDSVIVNRNKKVERNDIIVIHLQGNQNPYIKRAIAIGGDRIYFRENTNNSFTFVINDVPLDEPYLDKDLGLNLISIGQYSHVINTVKNATPSQYGKSPWYVQPNPDQQHYSDRMEINVPPGYVFFVGDNRGGTGIGSDYTWMSKGDSMWVGPQSLEYVKGVAVETMHHNSAPKWFWDKIVWLITFRWITG